MDLMINFNIREVRLAQFQSCSLSDVSSLSFLILFNDFPGEFWKKWIVIHNTGIWKRGIFE